MKIIWNHTVLMAVQLSQCPKNHGIAHFKWVNCTVCGFYLGQAVINQKGPVIVMNSLVMICLADPKFRRTGTMQFCSLLHAPAWPRL